MRNLELFLPWEVWKGLHISFKAKHNRTHYKTTNNTSFVTTYSNFPILPRLLMSMLIYKHLNWWCIIPILHVKVQVCTELPLFLCPLAVAGILQDSHCKIYHNTITQQRHRTPLLGGKGTSAYATIWLRLHHSTFTPICPEQAHVSLSDITARKQNKAKDEKISKLKRSGERKDSLWDWNLAWKLLAGAVFPPPNKKEQDRGAEHTH